MIKFHFKEKCKEMLTMLSETLYNNDYEGLTYKERTQLQLKEMSQQIEQLLKENEKLKKLNN